MVAGRRFPAAAAWSGVRPARSARVAAAPSGAAAVHVAQGVRGLHTLVQTPHARRTAPRPPPGAAACAATRAQLLPLRVATVRALDETLLSLAALARSVEPLFHLRAVDRRLADLSFALCHTLAQ